MFGMSSIFIFRKSQSPLTRWGHLSKVKDEPDSDDIENNDEYQGTDHKQDPVAKSFPIEDSSVKTASKKSRESDFELVFYENLFGHGLLFIILLQKTYNSLF